MNDAKSSSMKVKELMLELFSALDKTALISTLNLPDVYFLRTRLLQNSISPPIILVMSYFFLNSAALSFFYLAAFSALLKSYCTTTSF